jgi:threonine/homoserine/homoserine lactone efflux protein
MVEALLKGLGFGLLLSIAVGPVLLSIIKHSLNNGHRGGFAFIFGVSASDIFLVLISNVFTQLFASIREYETEVGIAGCIFLVSMGVYYFFFKKVKVNEEGKQVFRMRKRDFARLFISGFFMNTLNPGIFLFWITTSTAVITHTIRERIIIFTTCLVWMLGTDILKVLLAAKIRNRLTPHNIHILNRINGVVLIVFGFALIYGLLVYGDRI